VSESTDDFFEGKRPWSRIKDEVLGKYMQPYLAKLNRKGSPILLIDGYAGPGTFEDGSNGSPLIMCEQGEKNARGNYKAIFINNKKKYHDQLKKSLQERGLSAIAEVRFGDTKHVLQDLPRTLGNQSVFLYLDPFGPTGCDFALLEPFLKRNSEFSTEIMLTLNMPGMPRLAAANISYEDEAIKRNRLWLTRIFGGEYWRDILLPSDDVKNERNESRDFQLVDAYSRKLAQYLPSTRFCPVRERSSGRIKYFIVFASRHKDSLVLLNDIAAKAYFAGMHRADLGGGLWGETDWREMRNIQDLDEVVLNTVGKHPGETRKSIWSYIVLEHFMRYLEPEYLASVKRLFKKNKLVTPNLGKTGQLNNDCLLFLSNNSFT